MGVHRCFQSHAIVLVFEANAVPPNRSSRYYVHLGYTAPQHERTSIAHA